ncbi:PP2C family protein-serine/threonine phosphatase [Nocardioides piscis]|uniref:Serine/threonine-protein phosphatase n=1 Tax=Nocardioides piscis TaxID=2714938 RepID=A0A6G7YEX1_9ACTN|nr:protein phosphatase 2C domain-containing protein [Nocardioides piscis]QIK75355.1 serine/threonine-protein phosphatase [Nocardioides piscis]
MKPVDLHHGAASEVGHVRKVNEDAFLVEPPVFVVADGMGGHAGGDVASRIVTEEFARLAEEGYDPRRGPESVAETLSRAQSRILTYGEMHRGDHPRWHAGTTCVAAVLVEDHEGTKWLLVNLGDSRIYRFNDGRLDQVSVDHSVVQELVDAGEITTEQAATHPERHIITRALGSPGGVSPDFHLLPLAAAERLLLCSDGVTGMIADEVIEEILARVHDPRDAAAELVRAALDAGGRDNATAVVVDVVGLVRDDSYDSAQQRASLEHKLGARP